jgi:sterol 3beta-glucosyltransferase
MKIIVPAIGSRGDVQPYIALCQGLQRAGHKAILATNPTMTDLVTQYDVTCAPVGPPVDMGLEGAKLYAQAGKNW